MSNMICPGYISNMTSAKCIGDFQINSPETAGILFFGLIILMMATWSALYIRKNLCDIKGRVAK